MIIVSLTQTVKTAPFLMVRRSCWAGLSESATLEIHIVSTRSIGYLTPMSMRPASAPLIALLGAIVCLTAACSDFKLPRLSDAPLQQSQPRIPASVTVLFDQPVRTAKLEHTACADTQWTGPLGDSLLRAFQDMGQARFPQFSIGDGSATAPLAPIPGTFPVRAAITLKHHSFTATTRTGSDDRYMAQLDIRLVATFYDLNGQPLPDAPLVYSETVKVWTPQYGSSSQCPTQQLDDVLQTATEHLAAQFPRYVGQLIAKSQTQTGAAQQVAVNPAPASAPASAPIPAPTAPSTPLPSAQPAVASQQDPDRYAVVVGLGLYRTPWAGWRDGLAFDSKEPLSLLSHSLNVPENHTLLLQDELAAQEDIEEAVASWLPKRIGKDSIVFFYFSGQSLADPKTGEVFLIPYDGTPASSKTRLISLRWLQSRIQRLGAKLALAVIDTPVAGSIASKDGKTKPAAPNWTADLNGSSGPNVPPLVQIARMPGTAPQPNNLLAGLSGPADLDHDGVVTLGEWLRSLRGTAITVPTLPPAVGVQSIPLSHISR